MSLDINLSNACAKRILILMIAQAVKDGERGDVAAREFVDLCMKRYGNVLGVPPAKRKIDWNNVPKFSFLRMSELDPTTV